MSFPLIPENVKKELEKRREAELEVVAVTKAGYDVSPGAEDEDEMTDDEKRARGAAATKTGQKGARKSIFRNIINPDSRAYPLEQQGDGGPRVADAGQDALGREYSDAVMDRIAGAFSAKQGGEPDAIPNAGAGRTFEGTTQDIQYRPQAFTQGDGEVGQEPRRGPFSPNLGAGPGSYVDNEAGMPTRVGDMRLMNPTNSGIAEPADFRAPEPVQKSRRKVGLFKSAILGTHGDQADSFLGDHEPVE